MLQAFSLLPESRLAFVPDQWIRVFSKCCPYCGEMHSQLYVCEAKAKALAAKRVTNAKTVTNAK
jgi:hypothetical protein